jgi:hypothetical protein
LPKIVEAFVGGEYAKVDSLFQSMQEQPRSQVAQGRVWYFRGRFDTWRGDTDRAFEWFKKAVNADSTFVTSGETFGNALSPILSLSSN